MLDFLKPSVPIAKSFMFIPRISGIICGVWPKVQQQRSYLKLMLFAFSAFVVALGAVGENLFGLLHLNNLVGALEAFCPGVTKLISLFKLMVFFIYQRKWWSIIQRIRKLLMAEQHITNKIKIVEKLASIASIFSFILLMAGSATNMFFNLRPLMRNFIHYMKDEALVHELPFYITIPDIFEQFPLFPLTYGILTLSGAMTVFTFSFVDGFFVCACMYMSGIFGMLQYDIRYLFAELSECETSTLQQNKRFQIQLGNIVKRHNTIIDLCADFTANFTLIILLHFLSAALVLCLSLLDLMLVSIALLFKSQAHYSMYDRLSKFFQFRIFTSLFLVGVIFVSNNCDPHKGPLKNSASLGLLIYMFYSVAALTQLFLYCFGGFYISESSVAIADTLYDIEWYKCDVKTRKMILMMMRRSQKATTIAVPFFTPSLMAFASIISKAGSYITLLKTFL